MQLALTIILSIVLIIWLVGFVFSLMYMKMSFRSFEMDPNTLLPRDSYYPDLAVHETTFLSEGNRLKAKIYGKGDKGLVIFSHGIWSGPEEYLMLIRYLVDQGYTVFAYTYTSYNGSEGSWAKGLPQSPKDLDAALTYVDNCIAFRGMKRILVGHSWGGYATTAGLAFDHDIVAAVSISGFNDVMEITMDVAKQVATPYGAALLKPHLLFLNRLFSGKNWRRTAVEGINHANIPVLLLHGAEDDFIKYKVSSIPAHWDEITNPYVEALKIDVPGRSGHNNFFGTEDANSYSEEVNGEWKKREKQIPKPLRIAEKQAYYTKMDKDRANVINEDLFSHVSDFLDRALAGKCSADRSEAERRSVITKMR